MLYIIDIFLQCHAARPFISRECDLILIDRQVIQTVPGPKRVII
jgi:hypothetical protein